MTIIAQDNVADLWTDYRRGLITWRELQRLERETQPRCSCGRATNAMASSGPICAECMGALYRVTTDGHAWIARGRL